MGGVAEVDLAVHLHQLFVSKDEDLFLYDTIAKVHHPDYLNLVELQAIYTSHQMTPEERFQPA